MKGFLQALLLFSAITFTSFSFAGGVAIVSNGNPSGPGSLLSAIESGAHQIKIRASVENIQLESPLVYTGLNDLKIIGSGQVIDASRLDKNDTILTILNGTNLSVRRLGFIGSYEGVNDNSDVPEGGKGIFIQVPTDKVGMVKLDLEDVMVTRVGHHGIHVSDCSLGDDCGSGSGGGGDGSDASISIKATNVTINHIGFGRADADGLRVDDRGNGDILFYARNSQFLNVGADGVELDEGDDGDVIVDVRNTTFNRNGEYCNLITTYLSTPCDDDGDRDVDDGFDVDEAGNGSIYARITNSSVTNNYDEGLDFDEEGAGDIEVRLKDVIATFNEDEGTKLSEEDAGSIHAKFTSYKSVDNNGSKEGVEVEEESTGDVRVRINDSNFIGGSDENFKAEQEDGDGSISVTNSTVELDLDGVTEL